MPYSRVNWKNGAAGGTPLNQTNLNKMDAGIKDNENAIASTNEDVATNAEAIAANAEAIEELKNKPTSAMLLESTSPLEYATNNNIVGLYVEGKSEQYISKNLLPYPYYDKKDTITDRGITFTINKDGSIKINGTNDGTGQSAMFLHTVASAPSLFQSGKQYTPSGTKALTSGTAYVQFWSSSQGTKRETFTYDGSTSWNVAIAIPSGSSANNVVIYPMINEGSTALPYEPYTGTPSPTNIIPPINASGVIEASTINLLDASTEYGQTGATSVFENGVLKVTNTSANTYRSVTFDVPCEPNVRYTFSVADIKLSANNDARISIRGVDKDHTQIIEHHNVFAKGTYSFTTREDEKYIRMIFYSTNAVSTPVGTSASYYYPMLEEGTTASPYVEYKSNAIDIVEDCGITLRSIGNIADTLTVNEDGSAEWVQKVGYSVVDGSIDANISGWSNQNSTVCFYWVNDGINYNNSGTWIASDKFIGASRDYCASTDAECICMSGGTTPYNPAIRVLKSRIANWSESDSSSTKLSKIKAWLNSNNVTMYYPLATPIVHQLTKEQVDAIRQLKTYEGTTLVDAELANVTIKYAGDTKAYIDDEIAFTKSYLHGEITQEHGYAKAYTDQIADYSATETYVGKFLGKNLYRRVFVGALQSTNTLVMLMFTTDYAFKKMYGVITVMTDPINRIYANRTAEVFADRTGLYIKVDESLTTPLNTYEVVVEYTKNSETAPAALSLDDDAVVPMNEEEE